MAKVRLKSIMLGRLAQFIRTVPDNKLNMGSFCGTSRCLLGWAPSVPQLHDWGLRYGKDDGPYVTKTRLATEYDAGRLDRFRQHLWFSDEGWKDKKKVIDFFYEHLKGGDTYMVGALAFGIERREATHLFGWRDGFTPETLADDLVQWTARKKKEQLGHA